MREVKIINKKLYLLPSGTLVRVVKVNEGLEKVFVHNYDLSSNEVFELDFARKYFTPMLTIGEVCKIIGKKPHTLRTYEREGLIDKARKFKAGTGTITEMRLYAPGEVRDLIEFFSERRGPGRPATTNVGSIDRVKAERLLSAKYTKEK